MIAPLAVFGLVVDHSVFDFDFADTEVALEVGGIVLRVPHREFDGGKDGYRGTFAADVGYGELPDFQTLVERNKVTRPRLDAAKARRDGRIAQAVAANVVFEIATGRLPRGRPEFAGLIVAQVDVAPAQVERNVVIAIARKAAKPRITVEGISASRVRYQPEVGLTSQVIDPRQGGVGPSDHVLAVQIVEVPIFHVVALNYRFVGLSLPQSPSPPRELKSRCCTAFISAAVRQARTPALPAS